MTTNAAPVYVRTVAGNIELEKVNGAIVDDESRLLLLMDGVSNLEEISKRVPPSARKKIIPILKHMLIEGLIADANALGKFTKNSRQSTNQPPEELVKAALVTSQKFNKNVLLHADVEMQRRIQLEQELSVTHTKLQEASELLNEVMNKYLILKGQVSSYKQNFEAKINAQQAVLTKMAGYRQINKAENERMELLLKDLQHGYNEMQLALEQKDAMIEETVRARILKLQKEEFEKRKLEKIEADKMLQKHPHFNKIRELSFFKKFRNSDIAQLLNLASWREVEAGEVVIEEGGSDVTFYVVVSGKLGLLKGKETVNIIQTGEPFGEITHFSGGDSSQNASVVTKTHCTLLKLDPVLLNSADLTLRILIAEAVMEVQDRRLRMTVNMVGNLLLETTQ